MLDVESFTWLACHCSFDRAKGLSRRNVKKPSTVHRVIFRFQEDREGSSCVLRDEIIWWSRWPRLGPHSRWHEKGLPLFRADDAGHFDRPWRNNWPFVGNFRAGKRAAAVMSLIESAWLNGLDPWAYLKDVLERLPVHPSRKVSVQSPPS